MRFTSKIFPVLFCGAALLATGCGRGTQEERLADTSKDTQAPQTRSETQPAEEPQYRIEEPTPEPVPEAREVRPEPQVVVVDREPPSAPRSQERNSAAARERRLDERQAELDARERELREHERREAGAQARQEPRPAPEASPRETASGSDEPTEVTQRREAGPSEEAAAPAPAPELPRTLTVPAGTDLQVELQEGLASDTTRAGETFRARVVSDVRTDGTVAIPEGSEVVGVVDEAVPLRKVGGQAKLALRFTDLVLPSGATVPIHASLVQQGRSETKKDAATIGGAAAGGAILGRILNRHDKSKGTVVGAILGAAAGTAIASKTPGEEVIIPEGTVLKLNLDNSVDIRSRR
jgi:type IV secretory pathway VirB10-like protein